MGIPPARAKAFVAHQQAVQDRRANAAQAKAACGPSRRCHHGLRRTEDRAARRAGDKRVVRRAAARSSARPFRR